MLIGEVVVWTKARQVTESIIGNGWNTVTSVREWQGDRNRCIRQRQEADVLTQDRAIPVSITPLDDRVRIEGVGHLKRMRPTRRIG